jgi:CHRD domain-containing protein
MNTVLRRAALATVLAAAFGVANAEDVAVKLTGDQEVPAVKTSASGAGKITIGADHTVTGSVKTKGIMGTAAHIHEAPPGKSGPPIITLTKSGDDTWTVPDGSKLTDEQYKSFKDGNLYVNVHSAEHKPGEIRAQLKP